MSELYELRFSFQMIERVVSRLGWIQGRSATLEPEGFIWLQQRKRHVWQGDK